MKRAFVIGVSLVLIVGVALLAMALAQSTTIVATQGTPTIDGVPGDPGWGVPVLVSLSLPVMAGGGPENATLRAAYDDEFIYLSVMWQDPTSTQNIRKNTWTYDAATDSWARSQNEDRVYLLWNINAPDFESGCAAYCHIGAPDWDGMTTKMGTNNPGDLIDVWHWKAARTNPLGYADDKHWVDTTNAEGGDYGDMETRLGDSGSGFYSSNKSGDLPQYMDLHTAEFASPFLFDNALADFDSTMNWSDGSTIPGYFLKQPSGSRADVFAEGRYHDGIWVVEFKRRLDTGNPDDAVFAAGQAYLFSLGISDNSGQNKNGVPVLNLRLSSR